MSSQPPFSTGPAGPTPSGKSSGHGSTQRGRYREDPMRAGQWMLRVCESRLALSASLSADLLLSALGEPLDSATDGDWLLDQAAAIRERYGIDGAGQSIAVIDSGIAWDHVALGGGYGPGYRVVGGWDFAENDADPYDDGPAGFHGSHVSGLLAGQSDTFQGIAPAADLIALRVFNDQGQGSLDSIEAALQWVHQNRESFANPISTVNLSLGAILQDAQASEVMGQLEDELQQLYDDGIVVVAAAGNQFDAQYPDRVSYPAQSQWVTAVGSLDADGSLSSFSQRQANMLVAPGSQVRSTVPDHVFGWDGNVDDFASANGTSMATPQIAGASALVRQAMLQVDPQADVSPERIFAHLRATSIAEIDQPTGLAYYSVHLQAAIESLLADVDAEPSKTPETPEPSETPGALIPLASDDLGTIDSHTAQLQPGQWYQLTASHQGLLSIGASSAAELAVVDAAGTPFEPITAYRLASADNSDSPAAVQHNYAVDDQQGVFVRITGSQSETVRFTNLLQVAGGSVRVFGTGESDSVRLDLSESIQIEVNGAQYLLPSGTAPLTLQMDGGGGSDTVEFKGSSGAERIVLHPASNVRLDANSFLGQSVSVEFQGYETVRFDGGGGADLASLYDTPGNDQLNAQPLSAQLTGVGYAFEIQQVARIYVHATAGGEDTAFLYDSAADDTLVVRPQFTSLRSEQHFNLAYGFERVYAFATAGGHDVAKLYDSAGDDRMSASAVSAALSGSGYYASARNFETVEANATMGGHDVARLYAANESVAWQQAGGLIQWTEHDQQGDPLLRIARGFEQVDTYSGGQAIVIGTLSTGLPQPVALLSTPMPDDTPSDPPMASRSGSRDAILWDVSQQTDQRSGEVMARQITTIHSGRVGERDALAKLFAELGLDADFE